MVFLNMAPGVDFMSSMLYSRRFLAASTDVQLVVYEPVDEFYSELHSKFGDHPQVMSILIVVAVLLEMAWL